MILTLTPNPALDVTYAVDHLDVGASHRVRSVVERAGGKGVNVASVLRQTGHAAGVYGPVGGAVGDQLCGDLRTRGVAEAMTHVNSPTRRTVTVIAENAGSATVLNEPGSLSVDEWRRVLTDLESALTRSAEVLVASGSLPAGVPEAAYADVVRLAHEHGVPTIIDTGGPALLTALDA
ncbi:1-phosphofructokinase family hexose kinase [Luteipulveratus halotolerans]|uniref:1-phosphofructokinase family hexose kinase n=1 Tax=Luteipulveratus halotolerans TaxID=1631356 RepID=UPI0018D10512|nr:PfkB family carbohydrate kinase [Luteipulveratus halotolerans]